MFTLAHSKVCSRPRHKRPHVAFECEELLIRPCVDCGRWTGRYCDYCSAEERSPAEAWEAGQLTPLCSVCDNRWDCCHYCRALAWATPGPHGYAKPSVVAQEMERRHRTWSVANAMVKARDDMRKTAAEVAGAAPAM